MHDILYAYGLNFLEKSMLGVIPEAVIIIFAFLVLFISFSEKLSGGKNPFYLSIIGTVISFLYVLILSDRTVYGFQGSVIFDPFSVYLFVAILLSGLFAILLSESYIDKTGMPLSEYYSLILFGMASMMFLVSSANLIMIFLSIEFMSITAYILTGYIRGSRRSTEAAVKYFVLGAFASAFLLFGAVFIYAASGHLDLYNLHSFIGYSRYAASSGAAGELKIFLSAGLILFLVGFAFKMSLFPFHSWTPDAYDGAPTPVTSFMATGVKAAAFAVFLRTYSLIYGNNIINFKDILWILAVLSMTFGNIAALMSVNIKRLLAYSSIAQAGYIIIGIIGGGFYGYSGTLFYLLSYVFMTAGAFAIVTAFENSSLESLDIKSYSGLGYRRPLIAASLSVFMLSLAGIPVTSGFMGKFYVFSSAVKSGYYMLVLLALLNSAFAAFYYIKIIVKMYMPEKEPVLPQHTALSGRADGSDAAGAACGTRISDGIIITVIICLALTILMGVYPQVFINFAINSASSLWRI